MYIVQGNERPRLWVGENYEPYPLTLPVYIATGGERGEFSLAIGSLSSPPKKKAFHIEQQSGLTSPSFHCSCPCLPVIAWPYAQQ